MSDERSETVMRKEFDELRGRVAALQGAIYLLFRGDFTPDVALAALMTKAAEIERTVPQPYSVGFVKCLDSLSEFLADLGR